MGNSLIQHLTQKEYWAYIARSAGGWFHPERFNCPHCGARKYTLITRKLLITMLVRCESCRVLYRVPNDPPHLSEKLYQDTYDAGVYSDLPSDEKLRNLVETEFSGTERDHRKYIEMLRAVGVGPGKRLFEFGASWGYGTWQFQKAGYEVMAFEVGKTRARYAREKLGVQVEDELSKCEGQDGFDCFSPSHVLEHIPVIDDVFRLAKRLLRPGGLFIAITPNGSLSRFRETPRSYQHDWGMYHPIFPDEEFYQQALSGIPFFLGSPPLDFDKLRDWDRRTTVIMSLTSSGELFLASEL